jgi:hypothetical protein
MKTKKPRSGKAAKPAAQTLSCRTRSKPKTPRRKASLAAGKGRQRKTTSKVKKPARVKTKAAAKIKRPRNVIIRKPRASASPIPVVSEPLVAPLSAGPEAEAAGIPAKKTKAPGSPRARLPVKQEPQPHAALVIPQILLESDEPTAPPMTGPGQKYALGPTLSAGHFGPEEAALPEAYGTAKLLLAARDPHWLYAHWDLTREQQRQYNALAADRHLVVRVYPGTVGARPATEVPVHPESQHWFIHVDSADTRYVAELGYYPRRQQWVTVAVSSPAVTPADAASTDQTLRFATIPAQTRLMQLAAPVKETAPADLLPAVAAQERALAEMVALPLVWPERTGSAAAPELVRGRGEKEIAPSQLAQPTPLGGEAEGVSSAMAPAEQRPGGFWFNVNAELVLYGATEPGASVSVGGRPVPLRPDGTFSCRCSLPDGEHEVTVSALSAEGELRQAALKFSRMTDYRGEAGPAPQDPLLKPPGADTP